MTLPRTATPFIVPRRHGRWLLLASAVAFSSAGLFSRLTAAPLEATIVWRNLFGCLAMAVFLLPRGAPTASWRIGLREAAVIAFSAFATVAYLAAFALTSVAHVAVIYAAAPLVTAILAWALRGEAPSRRTLGGGLLALAGVAVTVSESAGSGSAGGDALAVLMTLAMAAMAVAARGSRLSPIPTAFLSSFAAAAPVAIFALATGGGLAVEPGQVAWLAGFGVVTMAIALPCYLKGLDTVPAGEAMLISALELPFAPAWVWAVFGEAPSLRTVLGGAAVAVAVVAGLGWRDAKA